ncbi:MULTISPECIES: hypothetical protein [unclassified Phenylobacterium]|uniref:hypothetical protein n=1 Tax=unclassified Phenylobacterium TaxID=2640670 RepID=UPI00083AF8BA|nr:MULTISPECIES: hypothetical protein [unclassified Phenylobacterium]
MRFEVRHREGAWLVLEDGRPVGRFEAEPEALAEVRRRLAGLPAGCGHSLSLDYGPPAPNDEGP